MAEKKEEKKKETVVPSMDEIIAYLNRQSRNVSKNELARAFHIKGDDRKKLRNQIKKLTEEGRIAQDESKNYRICLTGRLPERCQLEITGQDSMGDLLARPHEWYLEQTLPQVVITKNKIIPPAGIGDIIQAKVKYIGNHLYEGEVVRRLSHGNNHLVGVYEDGKVFAVDRRLTRPYQITDIPRDVKNRDLIIFNAPMSRSRMSHAKFVRRLGAADAPFAATLMAIFMHKIPIMFSAQTEKQVAHVSVPKADKNRMDLQAIPFVTIDGADARDFDDAVWAEPDAATGGFHVMIGIADVSWYVRSGTALDHDAWARGNSVYFPDRVIPMLPFELSNGVCSLKPNEPRAALVCEVWLDKNGHKIKHRFVRALIRSVRRLTYPEVQDALDGKQPIVGLEKEIAALKSIYLVLQKQRQKRGVIEINVPEQEIKLNKEGNVIAIQAREQTESMKLIEELMILANVSAAETLQEKGVPAMFRVHNKPSNEKIALLNTFLKSVGMAGKHPFSEHSEAKDFNAVLQKAAHTNKDFAINEFILRSQSQAIYSPENIGHFGLALNCYAHFTSPIRRYADLMVHRALIKALKLGEGGLTSEEEATFERTAQHISYTERQAASAENDAKDRYLAHFMENKVNQKFTGQISSVTSFGLFVRIQPYHADGFIPLHLLTGDYFEYEEEQQTLVGRATGKSYTLGDEMAVLLTECNPITGSLTFKPLALKKKKESRK